MHLCLAASRCNLAELFWAFHPLTQRLSVMAQDFLSFPYLTRAVTRQANSIFLLWRIWSIRDDNTGQERSLALPHLLPVLILSSCPFLLISFGFPLSLFFFFLSLWLCVVTLSVYLPSLLLAFSVSVSLTGWRGIRTATWCWIDAGKSSLTLCFHDKQALLCVCCTSCTLCAAISLVCICMCLCVCVCVCVCVML